ncbi:MAG: type II secretion system F family protein [Gammaproteobacteria bacterium]|nr:type II secretion system F family protein [Rhodocyclaceae bacterium]MBU3908272.1 type II secretion system F family protein [Gammaproteobacteria bacterium]MBU3989868.1 type II secretion system F family protein [Gammaproteobacteria bacterium]MBU4003091.1 type II secretion system F family protein [Gammaproteobacteria bacterium]MBU4019933.1 type II secretion system F family protein [Gammaproteobacteria bacterium]
MPAFTYRGRNGAGEVVNGVLEGATASSVADLLFGSGVTPLEIKPAAANALKKDGDGGFSLFAPQVLHVDILLFTRQLYTLMKAGVPIMRALAGLQESSANPAMQSVLGQLRESLDSGRELSVSMARHPKIFTPFYLAMVRVGEMTGRLEEVFLRLFDHMEFERFMHEQVKSALRYPSFVILAMVAAMFVVNIWVIPTFAKVFAGFGADLPLITRALIGFSNFMVEWWHLLIGAIAAAGFAFKSWIGTQRGSYLWDKFKMRIPIAGKIVRKATLARFARSFALASRSGVPIIQALTTVSQTVDNDYIAAKVEKMRDSVERGESVLRSAIATKAFTPVVLQMIAVGEESGSLDEMMEEISAMYQSEVEYELKTLSQQIEPILIVMLGAMVLVLALGIFLPLWDLGGVAMKK